MKSRSDIDTELARLEALLPGLVARLPAAQVLDAFAAEARPLTEQVAEEHQAEVTRRLNCMLAAAGLVPGRTGGGPRAKGD